MARLSVRLLGSVQVTLDGQPVTGFVSDKVRALLAYLAVEADRPHRREALAGLLWPEWPERSARTNLRRALANLRQVIGDHQATPPFLLITRQTIQFNAASDAWVDVTAFAAPLQAPGATIRQLEEAVGLYQGSFMEGFSVADSAAFEEWALLNREQLGCQVVTALHRLSGYYGGRGAYEQALAYAWRQVELDPWQEEAHRQLMRLLALSGQRNAALAQYETLRHQLAEELGVEPEEKTTRLYEQIRDGELERDAATLSSCCWRRWSPWVWRGRPAGHRPTQRGKPRLALPSRPLPRRRPRPTPPSERSQKSKLRLAPRYRRFPKQWVRLALPRKPSPNNKPTSPLLANWLWPPTATWT